MKFGVVLPLHDGENPTDPAAVIDVAQAAEALGFESIWLQDAPTGNGLDSMAMLAAVAARTRRPRLGFSILVLPQRETVVTARTLATIDVLSRGRVVLGVGVGSDRSRSPAYDVSKEERGRLMDEQIAVVRRLWDGENVTAGERWVRVEQARSPRPARRLPIWVGTWGNVGGLRRVVRMADGWFASGINTGTERFAAASHLLDELCNAAGRDPRSIERGYANCPLVLTGGREEAVTIADRQLKLQYGRGTDTVGVPLIGTPDQAREVLDRVAGLGADLVCVFPLRLNAEMLRLFRDEVAGGFEG